VKKLYFLFIIFSLFVFTSSNASHDFFHTSLIVCGPKKIDDIRSLDKYNQWQYYYIYFDDKNNVVIYNDGYEYNTWEKRHYSHLDFNQHQKTTSLKYNINTLTNVYNFELIEEIDPISTSKKITKTIKSINHFNFSLDSMTFSRRVVSYPSKKKYEPATGICWNKKSY